MPIIQGAVLVVLTVLKSIMMRFPNELKEAAMAISWKNDDGTNNWGKMA